MSWELSIHTPNKAALLGRFTHLAPGGVEGGFTWQRQGNGDCGQLDVGGRNDLLGMGPRCVVSLVVDGKAQFYGIVPDPPSRDSPDSEQAQVLGGREVLRLTLLDGKVYRDQGIFQIVRDILARLCPPSLSYAATLIGNGTGTDTGPTLSIFYSPTADLQTTFNGLAKSAKVNWGVDAQGRVFFGRPPAAALAVTYAGQPWRRLRVQGRETVTRALLRVVTTTAGTAPTSVNVAEFEPNGSGGYLAVRADYLPMTVAVVAEHAQHATYRAEASVEPPEGVGVIRPHPPELVASNPNLALDNPAATIDGDAATAGQNVIRAGSTGQAGQAYRVAETGDRVIGVRLAYRLDPENARLIVRLRYSGVLAGGLGHQTNGFWELGRAGTTATVDLILPPHARTQSSWTTSIEVEATGLTAAGQFALHEVSALRVDEAAGQAIAQAALQAPFSSPAEIILPTLVQPTETVTVTGSPDGDVTGPSGLFEFEHTENRVLSTKVRVGATGSSDAVRALRWAVKP